MCLHHTPPPPLCLLSPRWLPASGTVSTGWDLGGWRRAAVPLSPCFGFKACGCLWPAGLPLLTQHPPQRCPVGQRHRRVGLGSCTGRDLSGNAGRRGRRTPMLAVFPSQLSPLPFLPPHPASVTSHLGCCGSPCLPPHWPWALHTVGMLCTSRRGLERGVPGPGTHGGPVHPATPGTVRTDSGSWWKVAVLPTAS